MSALIGGSTMSVAANSGIAWSQFLISAMEKVSRGQRESPKASPVQDLQRSQSLLVTYVIAAVKVYHVADKLSKGMRVHRKLSSALERENGDLVMTRWVQHLARTATGLRRCVAVKVSLARLH
jgi:hypothetical protein